ncbi:MAG TPA: FAD-dependent oxidoreductase, partial [Pirellulaceae bacterium]|nr:FAD-dependent oxidoreductase [Pirellulaceae bacterium]
MAIDTPARLAILGAGPLGLEAALYARFLGYDVEIFEQGRVGEHVRRWGHERMFAPFGWNRSTLGLAAIATHDETYAPPRDDLRLTGDEWLRQYVEPLAATDLLSDHIRERATVVRIARGGLLKTDLPGDPDRGDFPLRLLVKTEQGGERVVDADGVIDTTGVLSRPNFLGEAGLPALGELAARHEIEYGLPDVHGARRDDYAGRHTLVVGDGDSAATVVVNLARLAESSPTTKVTWVTRELLDDSADGPLARLGNDPLPARDELRAAANRLSRTNGGAIVHLPGTAVQSIARTDSSAPWTVGLIGQHAGELNCDRIVGCVGHRPDRELTSEL